jgi:hypothetical protein
MSCCKFELMRRLLGASAALVPARAPSGAALRLTYGALLLFTGLKVPFGGRRDDGTTPKRQTGQFGSGAWGLVGTPRRRVY